MADKAVRVSYTVASVNGSQANGRPVYVGGFLFNVQTRGPGTLSIIEVSNDKARWDADTSTLGNDITAVTTRPLWARGAVATDGSGPRNHFFDFVVMKQE